jgi:hypothetical protein
MLREKILNKMAGIITYGLTPPKQDNTHERIAEISQRQKDRLQSIDIDGLIIYDIQEESDRIKEKRPFPFLPTLDPVIYEKEYLSDLNLPKIIYRCVGKYSQDQLSEWIKLDSEQQNKIAVFVGASSNKQEVKLRLSEAYELSEKLNKNLILGGVTISERHIKQNDEHLRIIRKMENGCKFFVSQAVYNVEASKNFLSDYFYYCQNNNIEMVPILFTLTPCGSIKTIEFMKWLGISIPKWLENDLMNSEDILDKSINLSKKIFQEIFDFALEKKIPIGCNIESVSVRKTEIEASIQLVNDIRGILKCGIQNE